MSDIFVVPPVEESAPQLSPEEVNDTAFYAAATSSQDPIRDYHTAKADLELTGQSSFVTMAQEAWEREQDASTKEAIGSIIGDKSIPTDEKKVILQTYALTGFVEKSLKEKYIQKQAANQYGPTVADMEHQDAIVATLEERRKHQAVAEKKESITKGLDNFMSPADRMTIRDSIVGGTAALTDILVGIPAGIGKAYSLLVDKDIKKAEALKAKIQDWALEPDEIGAQKKRDDILNFLAPLGSYNQKIYEEQKAWGLKQGLDPAKAELNAMLSSVIEDPLSWIGIGAVAKTVSPKPILEVPVGSPAKVTQMANPQMAARVGSDAVVEKTGKLAEAIGSDRGTIVHDWVLAKPMPDAEQKMRPDLVEELRKMDTEARTVFQEYRYDPSLMDATKREEEVARVWQVIKEQRSPYYQQSNSIIIETPTTFEGKAIYGRSGSAGWLKEDAAIAARDRLQESLDQLPEDLRGNLSIIKEGSEYRVQHEWKKEYDEMSAYTFGPDSIQTSMLGIDFSTAARSTLGRWLFPTGWLPTWAEKGAARGISRGAVIEQKFISTYRDRIASTPYGKELSHLINEAEELGRDYFSPKDISSKFPHLSTKAVNELFETHIIWRRLQDYNYNFFNRIERGNLQSKGMQGLYDNDGNFVGPVSDKVGPAEIAEIKSVWNMDSSNVLSYTDQLKIRQDKTIVRLHTPMRVGDEVLEYALVGTEHKLGMLPKETLPRIPGYSPRKVKENYFVDATPTNLRVNGVKISDPLKLRNYSLTKAAARNEREALAIQKELQAIHPDHTITVRPERTDNYGQLITDYKVYHEMFQHSMQRGERLPSRNGPARIEDRMLTAIDTTKMLSRLEAFSAWDNTFQKAYVKAYGKFLPDYTFPTFKTDIRPLENMDKALKKEFDTAHRLYEYYANQKNFETLGDFLWKKGTYYVADVLEKFCIPGDLVRELGKNGNPLMAGKTAATALFIHLSPLRQWIMQPSQMMEIMVINPTTGIKNLSLTGQVLMELGTDAKMVRRYNKILKFATGKLANASEKLGVLEKGEFANIMKGIRQSGIVQSVDMNSILHGVFKDVDRAFTETTWESGWAKVKAVPKGIAKIGRTIGYDPAEITNQIGIWLQVKDMWKAKNPDKVWHTKESIEEISHEAWRLSGNMTRAGNLPYQQGALSVFFQFAAIQQKLLMSVLQDNATILTPVQRAKLASLRLVTLGAKYGVPGGGLLYWLTDHSDNEELKEFMNQEVVRRGLLDYAVNRTIAAVTEPDERPDLAVSKMLSPYSESFLPYLDVIHSTWMMLDDDPVSKPRYPTLGVMSSFGKAIDDMQGWWKTKDVNPESFKMMAMEAAELASGMNSYWQGQLMLGMQDKVSRMGNKYDIQVSKEEAYAKMFFGVPTQKEEDLWAIVKNESNAKKKISDMAKDVHTQLMNQRTKIGEADYEIYGRRLNSFMSMLDPKYFNEMDKIAVMEEIVRLDRKSFGDTRQSVFATYWQRYSETMTQDRQATMDILKRSNLPKAQELAKQLEEGKL